MNEEAHATRPAGNQRVTLAAGVIIQVFFLVYFLSRPLGGASFLKHRAPVAIAVLLTILLAVYLLVTAGHKHGRAGAQSLLHRRLMFLLGAVLIFWFWALLFCSVFPGVPFLNGDVVLAVSVASGLVAFRIFASVDKGKGKSRIRLRHKILFSVIVAFIAAEVLLRAVSGRIFPDSPEAMLRGYLHWSFFVEDEERKRQEKLARKWLDRSVPARIREPEIGFILNPQAFPDYPEAFNPGRHSAPAPEGVTRIACIGSSAVFYAYPRFLGDSLRKKFPGRKFDIVDASVPAYTSYHSLLNYRKRVAASRPDIAVIYHGINELKYLFAPGLKDDYSHLGLPWLQEDGEGGATGLVKRLAVVRFVNLMAMRLIAKPREAPAWNNDLDDNARRVALDHVRELIEAVRESGARPVLCTYPISRGGDYPREIAEKIDEHLYQYAPGISPGNAAKALETLSADLRKLAAETQTPLLDLEKQFPRKAEFFVDCCHYSERGAILLAEMIARFLEERGLMTNQER